jgi:HEAT repeat protein
MARLRTALLLAALALPALAEAEADPAVAALHGDPSLKVRTQAAIVLGQRGSPEAVRALRQAVAEDPAAAVRLAAVSALGRLEATQARLTLQAAAQADPDPAVRAAAARALAALGPVTLTIEVAGGPSGARLSEALSRQLSERGLALAANGELRLQPKVNVDVADGGGRTTFEAHASLVVVDGDGRLDLLESKARASVAGAVPDSRRTAYVTTVVEAAARGLGDDLAAKLGRR